MILAKSEPFTKDEIIKLQEQFETYIKTEIDIAEDALTYIQFFQNYATTFEK